MTPQEERTIEIRRGGHEDVVEHLENTTRLEGGEGLAELVLELREIWAE